MKSNFFYLFFFTVNTFSNTQAEYAQLKKKVKLEKLLQLIAVISLFFFSPRINEILRITIVSTFGLHIQTFNFFPPVPEDPKG